MKSSKPRTFSVLIMLTAGIIISVAATKPSTKVITVKAHALNNDTGFFKNLQVLPKNISKDSLDKIMDGFKAALGVRCNFCHVFNGKPDFASDDKEEKGIARYMMRMTRSIDSAYFNFEKSTRPDTINVVKCITCHHGNAHPDQAMNNNNNDAEHHDMPPGAPPPNGQMPPPSPDSSKHN